MRSKPEISLLRNGKESDYIINRIMGTVSQNTKNRKINGIQKTVKSKYQKRKK